MAMAHVISRITTPVFMGTVYFLVLTPIGLLVRVVKGNPLVHADSDGGFWVTKDLVREGQGTMERQF